MEKIIHARVTRSALTLSACPQELADGFSYTHMEINWDRGNFSSQPCLMPYASYEPAKQICRTYPNALHLVRDFAQAKGYRLEIDDQRARPSLDMKALNPDQFRSTCYQALLQVAEVQESGLIVGLTGMGKTSIICGLIALLPKHPEFKVLVTTEEKTVVSQIHDCLRETFPTESIGIVNKPARTETGRILVANLDALKELSQGELASTGYGLKDFSAWICDEVHRLPVKSRIPYISQLRPAYSWGLTATPKRSDNAQELNQAYFGQVLYALTHGDVLTIQEATKQSGIVPIKVQVFPLPTDKPIPEDASLYRKTMLAYLKNTRLHHMVQAIDQMIPPEEKVLLFVDTQKLAVILKAALPHYELVHGYGAPDKRMKMLEKFRAGDIRRVIATDVWSEGIDVPDLGYVVDCSYKLSSNLITQRAGRAARNASDKSQGQYLMFLCISSEHLFNHGVAKLQHFNTMGWDVQYNFQENFPQGLYFQQAPVLVELGSFAKKAA